MMEPSDRLRRLISFPGWGNPNNAIWFIGIEEAGEWTCSEFYKNRKNQLSVNNQEEYCQSYYELDIDSEIESNYTPGADGNVYFGKFAENEKLNPTYLGISKCFCKIIQSETEPRDYLMSGLCKKASSINTFLCNLNPLGVRKISEESWKKVYSDYKRVFDISQNSKSEYQDWMIAKRTKVLSNLFSKNKPKVIIAFGYSKGLDKLHLKLLKGMLKNENISFDKNDWITVNSRWSLIIKRFDNLLYILLPHFCIDRTSQFNSIVTKEGTINLYDEIRDAIK